MTCYLWLIKPIFLVGLIVLAVLAMTACGGGGGGDQPNPTVSPQPVIRVGPPLRPCETTSPSAPPCTTT